MRSWKVKMNEEGRGEVGGRRNSVLCGRCVPTFVVPVVAAALWLCSSRIRTNQCMSRGGVV
jgi:hypothetical protein